MAPMDAVSAALSISVFSAACSLVGISFFIMLSGTGSSNQISPVCDFSRDTLKEIGNIDIEAILCILIRKNLSILFISVILV